MFTARIVIDWNVVLAGLALSAAIAIVVAAIRLSRRLRGARHRASALQKWVGFPGKHGLALAQSIEGSAAYEGVVEGFKVQLKRGAKFDLPDDRKRAPLGARYVCIAAQCTKPQPAGLQLWAETESDAVRKETRKLNEVVIGIEKLDRALIIRGKQALEIRALLGKPELSAALLEFFEQWPGSIVTDYWVRCEADLDGEEPPEPEAMLHAALHLAKMLDKHAQGARLQETRDS